MEPTMMNQPDSHAKQRSSQLSLSGNNSNLPSIISLGNLTLNLQNQTLIINETSHHLRLKLFHLLIVLMEYQGKPVTREELINRVWKGNYYIGEKGLTHAICMLRTILKQPGASGVSIETVLNTGYQLKVKPLMQQEKTQNEANETPLYNVDTNSPSWWPQKP
jgi:DNA-binding winged helix-turn-helix (wHTH) protein